MAGKEKFTSISVSAVQKRISQLKEWENSETNKMSSTILPSRRTPKIKFPDSVVFLAAAHSGDTEEVERLVKKEGADVNSVNKDGLTSLHQVGLQLDSFCVFFLVISPWAMWLVMFTESKPVWDIAYTVWTHLVWTKERPTIL